MTAFLDIIFFFGSCAAPFVALYVAGAFVEACQI